MGRAAAIMRILTQLSAQVVRYSEHEYEACVTSSAMKSRKSGGQFIMADVFNRVFSQAQN